MRKFKSKFMGISLAAALVFAVGATTFVRAAQSNPQSSPAAKQSFAAAVAPSACKRQSAANALAQEILLSTAEPRTYTGTAWQNVDCTSTTFRLKPGERALVVADVSAETDCMGKVNGQWCQARALLNGLEGAPVAAESSSFAFDSVTPDTYDWQAHSMNRGWEIRCGDQRGCQYKFVVQTRMHDTTVTGLWLDEVAAHLSVTVGAPAPL